MPEIDYTLPILDIAAVILATAAIFVSVYLAYHVGNIHSKTQVTHDLLREISAKLDAIIQGLKK